MSKEISKEKTNSLLNCPFCGGEAKIDKTITNTVSVECTVCHASSRIILCTEGDIEQKAIKAWNTRKPIQNIVERLDSRRKEYEEASNHPSIELSQECYYKGIMRGYEYSRDIVKEEDGLNE